MTVLRYTVIWTAVLFVSCSSTEPRLLQDLNRPNRKSSDSISQPPHPTVRRYSTVIVSGLLDSVILTDSDSFMVRIRVLHSEGEDEALPSAGEILETAPKFIRNEPGTGGAGAARAVQFARLRSARKGDTLRATLLRTDAPTWMVLSIDGN